MLFFLLFFHCRYQTCSIPNVFTPPSPPCLSNTVPLCNFYLRLYIPTSNLRLVQPPVYRMCGSTFSSRLIVKVGLFPCVTPCAGSAHPRQHHPGQPRHTCHPADPRGGRPEPWGTGPDDLDGEVRRRAGQATRCGHTGGDQRYLQHEAVSLLKHQVNPF